MAKADRKLTTSPPWMPFCPLGGFPVEPGAMKQFHGAGGRCTLSTDLGAMKQHDGGGKARYSIIAAAVGGATGTGSAAAAGDWDDVRLGPSPKAVYDRGLEMAGGPRHPRRKPTEAMDATIIEIVFAAKGRRLSAAEALKFLDDQSPIGCVEKVELEIIHWQDDHGGGHKWKRSMLGKRLSKLRRR